MSYVYIYNKQLFFYFFLNTNTIHVNKITSTCHLLTTLKNQKLSEKNFQNFIKSLSCYFIKKIKFNGKSYRIEKKIIKNFILFDFKFGHSIDSFIYLQNFKEKQSKKSKLFF